MYESMKNAGYKYIESLGDGRHVLADIDRPNRREVWFTNKNHASYGIKYKNTHLEFAYSYPANEKP